MRGLNKAVFLDRDGVINPLAYNPQTNEYESPHYPEEFGIYPYVLKSLQLLRHAGFLIFVVSNQPSYAKGKIPMENLREIAKSLDDLTKDNGGLIDGFYYCYHHPDGIVPEYAGPCKCRKPGTLFPERAVADYDLDRPACYFVGDQDSDIRCGKSMGFRTVKIDNPHSARKSGKEEPDEHADNLYQAVLKIIGKGAEEQ